MTKHILKNQKGVTIILFALMLTALMGCGAIVMDVGRVILEKYNIQNALDSAVLAAAKDLPNTGNSTNTAIHYIEANGYSSSDISISFSNSNTTISIGGTKTVKYTFAKILGLNNKTVHSTVSATLNPISNAFKYSLFSGSTLYILTLDGSQTYISGDVHSNDGFRANGSHITVTGTCEAVETIDVNGTAITITTRLPNASYIDMPDFSEQIKLQAQTLGEIYSGNKTYNGNIINPDNAIFVDGDLTIKNSTLKGIGTILATGNITIDGDNEYSSNSDSICIYSKNGNVTFTGSHATVDGIIYAPKGSVTLNGSNQTINGRIIANTITMNGSNSTVIPSSNDLTCLPSGSVKLTQ